MINKIGVANRGEIACRVIRSVQAAGYDAVAVHSDVDAAAPFVALADESVALGGNTSAETYLDIDKVIGALQAAGADAVHPGYGFLSENAAFARACAEAGITFIGPPPAAIESMGDKATAKQIMLDAGVPCIPGYQGSAQDDATLTREAEAIGYPLMVKAAAGGGGRGMRLAASAADLPEALSSARSEAASAFGSDVLILEKAVVDSRHIEIQVVADSHGNVIHLAERDCSAQRRHQKVIEEAPSPFMTPELRAAMGDAAVLAAKTAGYEGVGTVEFLVDGDRNFYFLEMNTRLQVEHPVTELVTGVDLVDWQLRIAAGEPLPMTQDELSLVGHSIEVRIYAEDPARGFIPQTGRLGIFEEATGPGVRIDHGVESGVSVSPFYDSMLAKLIAWGRDREEARRRLVRALSRTTALGLTTNKTFLIQLLSEQSFIDGEATTAFIDEALLERTSANTASSDVALAAVVLDRSTVAMANWSNAEHMVTRELLRAGDEEHSVVFEHRPDGYVVTVGDVEHQIDIEAFGEDSLTYSIDGVTRGARFLLQGDVLGLDVGERAVHYERLTYAPVRSADAAGSGRITATTEGLVTDILVAPGDTVTKGQTLVVVEAMKMEHRHTADGDGSVAAVSAEQGQQVKLRQLLVELTLGEEAS